MAIYHLSVKTISRSAGRSATAAAAYRAGVEITDERTGEIHDYRRKGGVESAALILPDNAPEWARDRARLWNAAEQAEKRANSTVAREFEIALPAELSPAEREKLAHDFARELVKRHGVAADVAIHAPGKDGDDRNHHAHILLTTRRLGPDGLGEKTRELDDRKTGPQIVAQWRERFAALTNERLRENGIEARVDHRTLEAQGIEREPTRHLGPAATGYERRTGEPSRKRQDFEQEAAERLARAREAGELERQGEEADRSIIDLSGDLEAAKRERAERERRERVHQVKAIPAADLVKQWDAAVKDLAKGYRQRADRLESRIRGELDDIGNRRWRAQVDHAEKRPAEVQDTLWNRITGKVAEYRKALADWQGTMKRIQSWKREREADLMRRLTRLEGYLSRTHYGYRDKATIKAERTLARKYPAWAQRVPAAREEVAAERAQQRALQQAERLRSRGRGRDRGWSR